MTERDWYSTRAVADLLGYAPKTIRRHIYAGKIPAWQLGDGGPWRIPTWWVTEQMDKRRPQVKRPKRRYVTVTPE